MLMANRMAEQKTAIGLGMKSAKSIILCYTFPIWNEFPDYSKAQESEIHII